jgi:hypothetical protein
MSIFNDDYLLDYKTAKIEFLQGQIKEMIKEIDYIKYKYVDYDEFPTLYNKISDWITKYNDLKK